MTNEKRTYSAPEAEIKTIPQEDVVLISLLSVQHDLDADGEAKNWAEW